MEQVCIYGDLAILPGYAVVSVFKPTCSCVKVYPGPIAAMTELRRIGVLASVTDLERTFFDTDVDAIHYTFEPPPDAAARSLREHGYICCPLPAE